MILLSSNVEAFLAVVECGTVSAAGIKLGLTQTAVTQRIRLFEDQVGTSLFTRSKSGMRLTDEGHTVFRQCVTANEVEGGLRSQIRQLGKSTEVEINIAGMSSILSGRVLSQIFPVLQKWPGLNINFHIESHEKRLHFLKSGRVDLAIMQANEAIPELTVKELRPIDFKLVSTIKWKNRDFKEILKNERMICYSETDSQSVGYLEKFGLQRLVGRKKIYTNENRTFQRQIELGWGYGILPTEICDHSIKDGALFAMNSARTMSLPISLGWYQRAVISPYMMEIISAIE